MPQDVRKKEVRIEDYFWTIWRSKFSILIIFLVAIITAFINNDISPPIYEAKSRIWIKDEQNKMPFFEDFLIGSSFGRATRIETLQEIIRSRHIVTQTVEELELDENPLPKHRGKIIVFLANILGIELQDKVYDKYTEDIRYYQSELRKLRDEDPATSKIVKCFNQIRNSQNEIDKSNDQIRNVLDKNIKDLDDYGKELLLQIKKISRKLALHTGELISYQNQIGFELYESESPDIYKYFPQIGKIEENISLITLSLENQIQNLKKEREFLNIQGAKINIGNNIEGITNPIDRRIELVDNVIKYAEQIVAYAKDILKNNEQIEQFNEQNTKLFLEVIEANSIIAKSEKLRKKICIESLRENLSVKPLRETNIIEVSVKNGAPNRAQEIVNTITKNFRNYMREDMQAQMQATTDFAGDKEKEIESELGKAEEELAIFQKENNMLDLETEAEMIITNLEKFKAQFTAVKEQNAGAKAKLENLLQQLNSIDEKVISSETLTDNPLLTSLRQDLISNRVKLAELKKKYPTGIHPDIMRLEAKIKEQSEEIAKLEKSIISKTTTLNPIHQQISSEIIQILAEIDATDAQEVVLTNRIAEYNDILKEMPEKQVELAKKKRKVSLYQNLLTSLQETKQQANIFKEAEVGNVTELDKAYQPDKPISPRKKVNLLLGAFIGMSLGIGLAFLRDAIDNKYHTIEEAQKDFDLLTPSPVYLGLIPPITGDDNRSRGTHVPLVSNISRRGDNVLEAFRLLRTKLQFLKPSSELNTMVVTSSVPGEGKTTIAVNTAVTLGRMEKKVLLIDADLRRPRLHKAFEKVSRIQVEEDSENEQPIVEYLSEDSDKKPGLSEILLEIGHNGDIEELTKRITRFIDGHENVHLIPSGTKPPEPSQLLSSDSMDKLLKHLKGRYDYIVIDAPPAGFADPMVLSEKVDCVLYVIDLAKAKKPEVRNGLENLIEIGSDESIPIGVICNWAEMPGIGYYYGYYYGGYYSYYRYRYGYYGSYYYDYYEDRKEEKKLTRLKRFLFGDGKKRIESKDDDNSET